MRAKSPFAARDTDGREGARDALAAQDAARDALAASGDGGARRRARGGALEGRAQVPGAGEQALDQAAAGDLGHREGGRDLGDGPAGDQSGVAEAMRRRSEARTEEGGDSPWG